MAQRVDRNRCSERIFIRVKYGLLPARPGVPQRRNFDNHVRNQQQVGSFEPLLVAVGRKRKVNRSNHNGNRHTGKFHDRIR
jgi:hypothetical protein